MGLTDYVRTALALPPRERSITVPWLPGDFPYMNFGGRLYSLLNQTYHGDNVEMADDVGGPAQFAGNSIVFACMAKRMKLFSEARPRYRRFDHGKPGDLWGDASLDILEHPWPGAATGDLLARAIADVDLYGNFYAIRRAGVIHRLPPEWVSIILSSATAIDARVLGYVFHPGGEHSGEEPEALDRAEVAHFAPYPDPTTRFRGMSWLTPILREVMGDNATTDHKLQFFKNSATPNMIVKRGVPAANESFKEWVANMRAVSEGSQNAYKTFYMSQGADATVVGNDFQQIELRATQGAGEVRIVIASGLHPVIVGVSESLQGSSLNSGNFNAARRLTADTFLRPDWRNFFSSMETLVPPPTGNQLWYDDQDIPFLREDAKDAAEIEHIKAQAIAVFVDKGFTRQSAKKAVAAQNIDLLVDDPDWVSVQVQAAKAATAPVEVVPPKPTNGTAKPAPIGGKA
jgi:hypothetical protein